MCPGPSSLASWAASQEPAFLTGEMLWKNRFSFFFPYLCIYYFLSQQGYFNFWLEAANKQTA